jgi:ferric enterobactin receptor
MRAPSRHLVAVAAIAIAIAALCLSASAHYALAQSTAGTIRGRLIEAGTGRAITGGSISVRRAADSAVVKGTLPRADGSFQVEGLAAGRYSVRFRALGFAPLVRSDVTISTEQRVADLGSVAFSPVVAQLEGQKVIVERDEVALAPDRNSYSVKSMTNTAGGTAVDVLRNTPAVEVDGSNKVSLRGNENVIVQINGRASPLKGEALGNFLAQLPASGVKSVEVATNPSAKNDPEGTAGIINIVLTQQAEMGLSGGVTAGTGTTGLANLSGNIGRQVGPWTLFTSYSFFRDRRTLSGRSERTNILIPDPAFTDSRIAGTAAPRSNNFTVRTEYLLAENNTLAFDAVVSAGRFGRDNAAYYANLSEARDITGLFNQFSNQAWDFNSQDYSLAYRRTGTPQTSTFSVEGRYTRSASTYNNLLSGVVLQTDASTGASAAPTEHDVTTSSMPLFSLQSDYTHPFSSQSKLESGFKSTLRSTANDFAATIYDASSGQFIPAPGRANAFDYREQINAVYGVFSRQVQKVQAQAGLRLEQASTQLDVPVAVTTRYDDRYASLFPSGLLSYNVTDTRQVKASYSRRITRPDPFWLTPFSYQDDSRNVFRGNPALKPEYTNAYELGFQETRGWGSVQVNPYLRTTAHAVRYIRTVEPSGITLGTFANLASTRSVGTDLNVNIRGGRLNLVGGGSTWRYSSQAGDLSASSFVWSARTNATWKLNSTLDGTLFANYRAPMKVEGGRQLAFFMTNFSLRQKLWGDQGSVTVRVQDPFSTMKWGFRTEDGRVTELMERRFGMRGLFITVSRNFGQQLKLKPRQEDGQQGGQPGTP